ncbi:MAG: hypothetical protein K1W37_13115 [Lachnospiraceae bacterium]
MDYNKGLVKLMVRDRLHNTFVEIIQDIPNPELSPKSSALIVKQKNSLMTYEQFYNIIYMMVLDYIPNEDENPLFKAIEMFPKAIKNIHRIQQNKEIINLQKEILDKYFYTSGDENIKEKLLELENEINLLIDDNDLKILDRVLLSFDERMRSGLLTDLESLSQLLNKRG